MDAECTDDSALLAELCGGTRCTKRASRILFGRGSLSGTVSGRLLSGGAQLRLDCLGRHAKAGQDPGPVVEG